MLRMQPIVCNNATGRQERHNPYGSGRASGGTSPVRARGLVQGPRTARRRWPGARAGGAGGLSESQHIFFTREIMAGGVQDLVIFMPFFQTLPVPVPVARAEAPGRPARAGASGSLRLLAGGAASVLDPAGGWPAESELDGHDESLSLSLRADSPAGQGLGLGSNPENRDQTGPDGRGRH